MLTLTLPLAALAAYFIHAAIWGHDGYIVLEQRRAEIAAQGERLESVRAERERLRDRTRRLRVDSIDLDLLDERARAVLGYARPDEMILRLPEPNDK